MPGTREGGLAAAATNKKKQGPDFYREIGKLGGKKSRTGGFYGRRDLAQTAGRKGLISKRGKAKNGRH